MNFFNRNKAVEPVNVFDSDYLIDSSLIHSFCIAKAMYNDLPENSDNRWTLLERMLELSGNCVEVFLVCMKSFGVAGGVDFRKRCVDRIEDFTRFSSSKRICERESFTSSNEYVRALFEMNQIRFEQVDLVNMMLITARLSSVAIEESGDFYDQADVLDLIIDRMQDFSVVISKIEKSYDDDYADPREWAFEMLFAIGNSAVQKCESRNGLNVIIDNSISCANVRTNALEKMYKMPDPEDIAYY